MSQIMQLEVPDALYSALKQQAQVEGTRPEVVAVEALHEKFNPCQDQSAAPLNDEQRAAQQRFERHFGRWDVGHPLGVDNERIDADLAAEYGRGMDGA
jgi:hypothetical protein